MPENVPNIVFMGSPEFAVASLHAIVEAGYPVKGVVTVPDKPSGRGLQLHPSPVKEFALKAGLPVLQPSKLKDPEFLNDLKSLQADLQVIVAFRMLPEEVWNMPALGTFNLHASLLPQYRGAAPINWAIINGETKTGVTSFFINHEIDKGSVMFSEATVIGEHENAGDVHDRLMMMGAKLVVKTIAAIANGSAVAVEQHLIDLKEPLKAAPRIFSNDRRIHWNKDVGQLHNFIRGLSPFPTAWTEMINGRGEIVSLKIFAAHPEKKKHSLEPGAIVTDGKHLLSVAASDGLMHIERLQQQARKQMSAEEFLRGFPVSGSFKFL
jgi:methionyl-tRNA formyltransferase